MSPLLVGPNLAYQSSQKLPERTLFYSNKYSIFGVAVTTCVVVCFSIRIHLIPYIQTCYLTQDILACFVDPNVGHLPFSLHEFVKD